MTNNILSSFPVHIVEGVHSLTAQRKLVNIIQYYSREILAFVVCLFFFFRFDQIWKKIRSPSLFLPCSQIVLAAAAYLYPGVCDMNAYEKFMQKTDLKREKNISNMLFLFFSE
jgi:hypothetical protein